MGKSLKEQNRPQIWAVIAINSLFFYAVAQAGTIKVTGLQAMFKESENLAPIGVALIISTILNGLLSADTKARLVFLRWKYALPGHRAFSEFAKTDPRIDLKALEQINGSGLPTDPGDQNKLWYKFYKKIDKNPAVLQCHRDFLLLRDYTGISVLFIVFYGAVSVYLIPSLKVSGVYFLLLLTQYGIVRHAAAIYGIRLVTTVLAQTAAQENKRARNGQGCGV